MKEDIEVSRLIALLKRPFPRIEKDFYRKLRRKIEEIDRKLDKMEYEEEGKELKKERDNLLMYGEKIYRKRMRSILVELSKKVTGGKVNTSRFTEEEMELFNSIYSLIEEKRKEVIEGQVDILKGKEVLVEGPEIVEEREAEETEPEEKEAHREEVKERTEERDVERGVKIPVRMLSSKPFVGLDGHYYYPEKGDILNLDGRVARILIEGGYAERIESR